MLQQSRRGCRKSTRANTITRDRPLDIKRRVGGGGGHRIEGIKSSENTRERAREKGSSSSSAASATRGSTPGDGITIYKVRDRIVVTQRSFAACIYILVYLYAESLTLFLLLSHTRKNTACVWVRFLYLYLSLFLSLSAKIDAYMYNSTESYTCGEREGRFERERERNARIHNSFYPTRISYISACGSLL